MSNIWFLVLFVLSRIICLELTNSGTLQDLLKQLEAPLPEACQRMIIHDVAEGLYYLHDQNILHNNLNSSCVYLKGSLPVSYLIFSILPFLFMNFKVFYFLVFLTSHILWLNKHWRKPRGKSRMDNSETLATLGTQDTGWRQAKQKYTIQNTKTMSTGTPPKARGEPRCLWRVSSSCCTCIYLCLLSIWYANS